MCALSALKCSSRASEEENLPGLSPAHTAAIESQGGAFIAPNNALGMAPPASGQLNVESRLLQLSGHEVVDDAPFEDVDDDEVHGVASPLPSRTASNDMYDTPNTSNRDPHRPSTNLLVIPALPDPQYDDFCQSNFNTPRMLHTQGSLGDALTPLASPDYDSEDGESSSSSEHELLKDVRSRSSIDSEAKRQVLSLPDMYGDRQTTAHLSRSFMSRDSSTTTPLSRSFLSRDSSTSFLFGEQISEEKKDSEEFRSWYSSQPNQDNGKSSPPRIDASDETPSTSFESLQEEESSSFSSVSSFNVAPKQAFQKRDSFRKRQKPAFFWRSHPSVTVCSYYESSQMPPLLSRSNSDGDLVSVSMDSPRGGRPGKVSDNAGNAPYLNPAVVGEMWMTSNPFGLQVNTTWNLKANSNSHPQGPPSTRSSAIIQSFTSFATNNFPAVFTRPNSTRLVNNN